MKKKTVKRISEWKLIFAATVTLASTFGLLKGVAYVNNNLVVEPNPYVESLEHDELDLPAITATSFNQVGYITNIYKAGFNDRYYVNVQLTMPDGIVNTQLKYGKNEVDNFSKYQRVKVRGNVIRTTTYNGNPHEIYLSDYSLTNVKATLDSNLEFINSFN